MSFGSLPLPATTAILTIASMLLVLALSRALRNRWMWVAAVVVPLAVAYCVYWMPVWVGGSDPSQVSAWEFLFMATWGGSGILGCIILIACLRMRRGKAR